MCTCALRTSSALRYASSLVLYTVFSVIVLLTFCDAQCSTVPFCDRYPECSRECMGAQAGNVPFFHSYGTDFDAICATGINRLAVTEEVFACVQTQCIASDAQDAWNQFVDECAADGHIISLADTPAGYETHLVEAILTTSNASPTSTSRSPTSGSTLGSSTDTATSGPPVTGATSVRNDDRLRPGEIAGIVVGIVGAMATAVGAWFTWRQMHSKRKEGDMLELAYRKS